MFEHETILSLIFLVLNFGVLIALGIYLFKRYGLAGIKERIRSEEESLQRLHERKEQLGYDNRMLTEQLVLQDVECVDLGNKIERWHSAYEREQHARYQELAILKERVTKKIEMQEQTVALDFLTKKVVPKAIEEATVKLGQQFASPQEGRQFLTQLIAYMERGKV